MIKLKQESVLCSTPVRKNVPSLIFGDMGEVSTISQNIKPSQTYLERICEAIGTVGQPRKGASFQKIKKYILQNIENSDEKREIAFIKKSLKKGLETGVLSRPAASKQVIGAQGHFIVMKDSTTSKKASAPKAAAKASGLKSRKADEKKIKNGDKRLGHLSDSEVSIVKGSKKNKKQHSSDSEMPDAKIIQPKKNKPKNTVNRNKKGTPVLSKKELKVVKKPKPTRLFNNVPKASKTNLRMDVSDSEVEVKKTRKNFKPHSSDTEFETSRVREVNLENKQEVTKKNMVKSKLVTLNAKDKASKSSAVAKDKSQKNGTKLKKITPKDSLELKETKDNAEKTLYKRGVK